MAGAYKKIANAGPSFLIIGIRGLIASSTTFSRYIIFILSVVNISFKFESPSVPCLYGHLHLHRHLAPHHHPVFPLPLIDPASLYQRQQKHNSINIDNPAFSVEKIIGTNSKFRKFCPTKFCYIFLISQYSLQEK